MALRAGYYGIKRGLKAKLTEIAGAWDEAIDKLNVTNDGVKANIEVINNTVGWVSTNEFDLLHNDRHDNASIGNYGFTNTAADTRDKMQATVWCFHDATVLSSVLIGAIAAKGHYEKAFTIPATTNYLRIGHSGGSKNIFVEIPFTKTGDYVVNFDVEGFNPSEIGGLDVRNIMVVKADVIDKTFRPFHDPVNTVLTEHKTTINAIISAATGAADFAAFKTAMEAITPLTRSIPSGSDQRSLQDITPEVEPEEKEAEEASEPVTKKRTTKKTVKEGE